MAKAYAVALFGGKGTRYGEKEPKQFLLFGGKPLFCYVMEAFEKSPFVEEVLPVLPKDDAARFQKEALPYHFSKAKGISYGGSSRQESVYLALKRLQKEGAKPEDLVLIQDGDRPNLSSRLIEECLEAAEKKGAAVTGIPAKDSLFLEKEGRVSSYLPRAGVYLAQTPQAFRFGGILLAHEKAKEEGVSSTDDASLYHRYIGEVALILGEESNLKITTQEDGERFREMLRHGIHA